MANADIVLKRMIAERIPLTVSNYITLAFFGDKTSLDELEGEEWCAVNDLIEDGFLVDTESDAVS